MDYYQLFLAFLIIWFIISSTFILLFFKNGFKLSDVLLKDIAIKDYLFRRKNLLIIRSFLEKLKNNKVKKRGDLRKYLGLLYYKKSIDKPDDVDFLIGREKEFYDRENLLKIFTETGWIPLDPWYSEENEWNNAKMILTDDSIRYALCNFQIPFNRNWSEFLFIDFIKKE
tara:strand:- start:2405 stop:2914 length:510 start_codon:yes stop_codon:yes gene_type:complete